MISKTLAGFGEITGSSGVHRERLSLFSIPIVEIFSIQKILHLL